MNVLALDTSDQVLSIALETENGVFYSETDAGRRHSELLLECIDELIKKAGIDPSKLNLVACMKGPGSFTGLRIGFSAAKGICTALGIPLVAIPTLDCLANPLSMWPGMVVPLLDAKKSCFYTALYRNGTRLTDFMDAAPEYLAREITRLRKSTEEPLILTGSGAELIKNPLAALLPDSVIKTDPNSLKGKAMELLKIAKLDKINPENELNSGPLYLRKSDAELNSV